MSVYHANFQTRMLMLTFFLGLSMDSLQAMQQLVAESSGAVKQAVEQKLSDVKPEEGAAYSKAWNDVEFLCGQNNFFGVKTVLSQLSKAYPAWGKKVFYRPCGREHHGNLVYFMQKVGPERVRELGFSPEEATEFAAQLKEDRSLFAGPYAKDLRNGGSVLLCISDEGKLLIVSAEGKGKSPSKVQKTFDWAQAREITIDDLADPGFVEFNVRDVVFRTELIQALEKE